MRASLTSGSPGKIVFQSQRLAVVPLGRVEIAQFDVREAEIVHPYARRPLISKRLRQFERGLILRDRPLHVTAIEQNATDVAQPDLLVALVTRFARLRLRRLRIRQGFFEVAQPVITPSEIAQRFGGGIGRSNPLEFGVRPLLPINRILITKFVKEQDAQAARRDRLQIKIVVGRGDRHHFAKSGFRFGDFVAAKIEVAETQCDFGVQQRQVQRLSHRLRPIDGALRARIIGQLFEGAAATHQPPRAQFPPIGRRYGVERLDRVARPSPR
jgi:hypothetical protein